MKIIMAFIVFVSLMFNWISPHLLNNKKLVTNNISGTLEDSNIDILNLNTEGVPIPGINNSLRYKKMANLINIKNADIVCLQECFSKSLRNILQDSITSSYKTKYPFKCNRNILGLNMDCRGGLMTLSKYEILLEHFYKYPNYKGMSFIEKIGSKGFLFTVINYNGKLINVINTHLYSGHSKKAKTIRKKQIDFMNKIIDSLMLINDYPLILAGDLNIQHSDIKGVSNKLDNITVYKYITEKMNFIDPIKKIGDNDYTFDYKRSIYCPKNKAGRQKLDYCLIKNDNTLDCIFSKTIFDGNQAVSDHLGLFTRLCFSNTTNDLVAKQIK